MSTILGGGIVGPSSSTAVQTVLLLDTFVGANGTTLANHTMNIGSGWTESTGTWQIQGNQGKVITTGAGNQSARAFCHANATIADVTANLTVTSGTPVDGGAGLQLRVTDDLNYVEVSVDHSSNTFDIWMRSAGSFTHLATTAFVVANATAYTLSATLSGANITATVNGGNGISAGNATVNQTGTNFGMLTASATRTWLYGNFTVTR